MALAVSACRPSLSLLALALSARDTVRAPSPVWDRTGHASPGCLPQASVACGAPGERWARRVVLEGPRGAGTRTESILPRRLRLWMLAVVVERPAKAPLGFGEASRRPGCRGTAPLLEASGSETPWRARAADSRWRLVLDVQGSSRWRPAAPRNSRFCAAAAASSRRRPTWLHPVGPFLRQSVRRPPGPRPQADACPPTSFTAGQGGEPCPAAPGSGSSPERGLGPCQQ